MNPTNRTMKSNNSFQLVAAWIYGIVHSINLRLNGWKPCILSSGIKGWEKRETISENQYHLKYSKADAVAEMRRAKRRDKGKLSDEGIDGANNTL